MRILHVTNGIDPRSGGPTRSVKGLCRALAEGEDEVMLFVHSNRHRLENPGKLIVRYGTSGRYRTAHLEFERIVTEFHPDIVHLHGLWMMSMHADAVVCRRQGIPYVISPRGMLDPWALGVKKWKKRLAMFLYQRKDLRCATALHVTAELEASHVRAAGFAQPCIIAPNGVDVPAVMPERQPDPRWPHTAIFLSRLHPGKGLLYLVDAWAKVKPQGWRMLVVGPDSYGHKKDVVERLESLGIDSSWEFLEAVGDAEKWKLYRSADLLIHPSVSENFGITIAEGLAAGLPVICTKGTPWSEVESENCGWWIDVGVEPLVAALKEAVGLSTDQLQKMGERGCTLVDAKYTWQAAAKKMLAGYADVV